ncbi:MAG: PQQ-binding-like beta-propeller repeat protein [Fimbriimonas sp.]
MSPISSPIARTGVPDSLRESVRGDLLDRALKLGQGVGPDGRPYAWMFDCRELLLDAKSLMRVARLLWPRLKRHSPTFVGGLTLASNPLTTAILCLAEAEGYDLKGFIVRREPKKDGLKKLVEGPEIGEGDRIVVLDDLINSGASQRQVLAALKETRAAIVAVGVVIDYGRAGTSELRSAKIPLEALFTLEELGMNPYPPSQKVDALSFRGWVKPEVLRGEYDAPQPAPTATEAGIWVTSDMGALFHCDWAGEERWRFVVRDKKRGVFANPLVTAGRVIAGAYDGFLYCLDSETGAMVWESRLGQWIGSSACSAEGRVYVGYEFGEANGGLACLDLATGRTHWTHEAGHYVHSSPTLDAARNSVVFGANDGSVYSVDAHSGARRWDAFIGGKVQAQPWVWNDTLLITSSRGGLFALDATTGHRRWSRALGVSSRFSPFVCDGWVIATGSSKRLVAMDPSTGRPQWVRTLRGEVVGNAARFGDRSFVVGTDDGLLYLIDGADGRLVWQRQVNGPIRGGVSVFGHRILAPCLDGNLYMFDLLV